MAQQFSIAENLARVREEIETACTQAGRAPSDVALMAVSKMHPATAIEEAFAAGQRLFGENRVQEWQAKRETLQPPGSRTLNPEASFHLIGPLQSNKTGRAAEIFDAVDTVDSLRIATRLNDAAASFYRTLPVLIEVKLSPEETKHGIAPEELPALLTQLAALPNLDVCGLMTVPPWCTPETAETARPYFRELRRLRDTHAPHLRELSMGMSNDFRIAIEEGSTCVRIGTAIFGKRTYA